MQFQVLLLCWQTFPSILRRVRKVLKTTHFICKEEEEVATKTTQETEQ